MKLYRIVHQDKLGRRVQLWLLSASELWPYLIVCLCLFSIIYILVNALTHSLTLPLRQCSLNFNCSLY